MECHSRLIAIWNKALTPIGCWNKALIGCSFLSRDMYRTYPLHLYEELKNATTTLLGMKNEDKDEDALCLLFLQYIKKQRQHL